MFQFSSFWDHMGYGLRVFDRCSRFGWANRSSRRLNDAAGDQDSPLKGDILGRKASSGSTPGPILEQAGLTQDVARVAHLEFGEHLNRLVVTCPA